MIISKPKSSALLSLGVFIIICFGLGSYTVRAIVNEVGVWYHYLIASLTLVIAFILSIRQLLNYKIIEMGERVRVRYPFRRLVKQFKLKEIIDWKETVIKTKNAPYRQLEIKFDFFMLKLSIQENSNYDLIAKYLKKRAGKKMIK